MIVELSKVTEALDPKRTLLILGSGSSIPSGGKSGIQLADAIAEKFGLAGHGYSLTEVSQIVANRAKGVPHLSIF